MDKKVTTNEIISAHSLTAFGTDCELTLEQFCKEPKALQQNAELPLNASNQAADCEPMANVSLSQMERVEFLRERSELRNSGEGRTYHKAAFTLSEVLITLGVIGVVAALTMPSLITNINERVNSQRQANIAYKVTQAVDEMRSLGLLNGSYKTTDQFVDELQKHLKIAKRCDAAHIADCWPTEKVTTSEGEEFEVRKAKDGRFLNLKNNTSNNVGLVLADGASIILTYDHNSQGIDVGDLVTASKKSLPVGFGKSEEFAYTNSSTSAIDFVMDVNGKKGPNSETVNNKYNDIRSFKAARFSKYCAGTKIPGIGCVVNLGTSYTCVTGADKATWDKTGAYDPSCWGGAKKACDDIGMALPEKSKLQAIYSKKAEYPELPTSGWFWSSTEYYTGTAWTVGFSDGDTNRHIYKYGKDGALCVGD